MYSVIIRQLMRFSNFFVSFEIQKGDEDTEK